MPASHMGKPAGGYNMVWSRSRVQLLLVTVLMSMLLAHTFFGATAYAADSTPAILTPEEQALTSLLLAARDDAGSNHLMVDPLITLLAEDRSADMATHNDFTHNPLDGKNVFNLLNAHSIPYQAVGETITMNQNFANTAMEAANSFMRSPSHRAVLLDSRYTTIGVGHAVSATGAHYFAVILLSS